MSDDLDGVVELARRQARAVQRIRRQRPYHCKFCGYRSFQSDCPRCGEVCEPVQRRRETP